MEEKRKLATDNSTPSGGERGWGGLFWLSALLLLEGAAITSMTIWQQKSLAYYSDRVDTGHRLLAELEEACVPREDNNGDFLRKLLSGKHHEGHVSREKRQGLSGLFHDLILAQERVLQQVCQRRTDLCRIGPKGEKGESGDAGVLGVSGSRGDVGVAGPSGDKGQRGAAGGSGSAGQQGPKGIKGDPGMQGTTGQEGEPGEKGSLGDMGPSGQAGANGTRGQKGEMGVAGHRGPRGAKGEPGPKGETGDPGPRGPAGDAGVVGPDGSSEDDGCICFELPTITGNFSDSVSVLEHHKLVLHCDVSDPTAKVTWRRTDGQSMPVNVNVTGNDIIFVAMAAVDAGVYECVTSSTVGDITKAVEITMIEPSKDDCDFEQGRFCLWTNTRDDKFDWTLNQGSTPTAHTGPTTDHTRGDGIGYYAFIETSDPRLNRDNARLASQVLNPSSPYCLNFWYYLYGQSIGNINVRIKQNGLVGSPVWTKTGPSEDAWHNAKISVPAQNTPFSLIIEGVRGDSYNGDAALDDITLTQGNCAP